MANALCELGTGVCVHGGTIAFTGKGTSSLKGGGSKIVTLLTIVGAPVTACPNPAQSGGPCLTVVTAIPGSISLNGDGSGAVLDTDSITTQSASNPFPGGSITAPGQTALTASG
jgi:hypothetical protein